MGSAITAQAQQPRPETEPAAVMWMPMGTASAIIVRKDMETGSKTREATMAAAITAADATAGSFMEDRRLSIPIRDVCMGIFFIPKAPALLKSCVL